MSTRKHQISPTETGHGSTPTSFQLSTDLLPERDRIAIWHEIHGRTLFNLGITPDADEIFRADATINVFDGAAITTTNSSRAQYFAGLDQMRTARDSVTIFTVKHGKARGSQYGRDTILGPGDSVAMLTSEMGSIDVLEAGCFSTICVPRQLVQPAVRQFEHRVMRPNALNLNALTLLLSYADMLQGEASQLDQFLRQSVATHLGDLVIGVFGVDRDATELAGSRGLRVARLRQVKDDVAKHSSDHDLSAESVGIRLGITSRYVRKLLDNDGTSFSEFVLEIRLKRAHRLLCDPSHLNQPIGTLAYAIGFGDLSYFNRSFRRRFGMTPRDVRRQAQDLRRY
jgi:AraC-like DNA-binding protein